jgi:hypothetical protein
MFPYLIISYYYLITFIACVCYIFMHIYMCVCVCVCVCMSVCVGVGVSFGLDIGVWVCGFVCMYERIEVKAYVECLFYYKFNYSYY